MAIGPLEAFVFPGTYTRTLVESPSANAAGAQRYPALIGVGQEEERVEGFEMVRGSSATADNVILGEDALNNGNVSNVADGVNLTFKVAHYPIVSGSGEGVFADDPSQVIVQVNGENALVQRVDAVEGDIILVEPPAVGDTVVLNYYFKRRDTYVQNEDLVNQADGLTTQFKVNSARIVKGDNGGVSATSTDIGGVAETLSNGTIIQVPIISVTVNGLPAVIESINGGAGVFTLTAAPANGATVLVNYFTNDWQNTYDILPAAEVSAIIRAGYDPGRSDFISERDYILSNTNQIHWGNSFSVETGLQTVGAGNVAFGPIQIQAVSMVDNRVFKVAAGTGDGSSKTVTLPFSPVRGDGSGKALTSASATANDLEVFVGATVATAVQVDIASISGSTVTLVSAPALGANIYVDGYTNGYVDDTWTFTNEAAAGKYSISGANQGSVKDVTVTSATSTYTLKDSVQAFIAPSKIYGNETVTVTIDSSGNIAVTSTGLTGSGPVNTGVVGQTYIDAITGFTFALDTATAGNIVFDVTTTLTASVTAQRGIPNLTFTVINLDDIATGDTAIVKTFNMNSDLEPLVGDTYYVTFDKIKQDFSIQYVESFPEVLRLYGPLAQNNPIVVAANLAFTNGAQALAIKQVPKAPGSNDANVSDYIAAINEFDEPLSNSTRPVLIQTLSTNDQVINYLKISNAQQTSIRMKNERTSYFGFKIGTTPEVALNRAKSLKTELLTAVYPDSAIISIPDANGVDQDVTVGGEYIACALAGADVSLARDVATPLTNVTLAGIKRLGRNMSTAQAAQVAQGGVTVLESRFGTIRILMALTTDLTSALTRDPRIVEVKHFVQRGVRNTCDPFIGRKMLTGLTDDIEGALNNYFSVLVRNRLIGAFENVKAEIDSADPTVINVTVYYRPIFGLNWIVVTHFLRSTL